MDNKEVKARKYKELANSSPEASSSRGINFYATLAASYCLTWPIIGRIFYGNYKVISCALARWRQLANDNATIRLIFKVLDKKIYQLNNRFYFWYLTRFLVALLQERQLLALHRTAGLEDKLMRLALQGPLPIQGYDAAYAFVGFSLWLFERGQLQAAIDMVEIAIAADETWGYPEYLLGWYGLFTKGIDSVEHFTKAVQIDWSFLQRINRDKICKRHPEIISRVRKQIIV